MNNRQIIQFDAALKGALDRSQNQHFATLAKNGFHINLAADAEDAKGETPIKQDIMREMIYFVHPNGRKQLVTDIDQLKPKFDALIQQYMQQVLYQISDVLSNNQIDSLGLMISEAKNAELILRENAGQLYFEITLPRFKLIKPERRLRDTRQDEITLDYKKEISFRGVFDSNTNKFLLQEIELDTLPDQPTLTDVLVNNAFSGIAQSIDTISDDVQQASGITLDESRVVFFARLNHLKKIIGNEIFPYNKKRAKNLADAINTAFLKQYNLEKDNQDIITDLSNILNNKILEAKAGNDAQLTYYDNSHSDLEKHITSQVDFHFELSNYNNTLNDKEHNHTDLINQGLNVGNEVMCVFEKINRECAKEKVSHKKAAQQTAHLASILRTSRKVIEDPFAGKNISIALNQADSVYKKSWGRKIGAALLGLTGAAMIVSGAFLCTTPLFPVGAALIGAGTLTLAASGILASSVNPTISKIGKFRFRFFDSNNTARVKKSVNRLVNRTNKIDFEYERDEDGKVKDYNGSPKIVPKLPQVNR